MLLAVKFQNVHMAQRIRSPSGSRPAQPIQRSLRPALGHGNDAGRKSHRKIPHSPPTQHSRTLAAPVRRRHGASPGLGRSAVGTPLLRRRPPQPSVVRQCAGCLHGVAPRARAALACVTYRRQRRPVVPLRRVVAYAEVL